MSATTSTHDLSALLYLSSPALPIGAFAYSQGLEAAIEQGKVIDRTSLQAWVECIIEHGLLSLDVPLLNLCVEAIENSDHATFRSLSNEVFAARESFELYEEERLLGAALYRLLVTQEVIDPSEPWREQGEEIALLAAFALAAQRLGMTAGMTRLSFCWAWLENQMAVAAKAIPLGQSDTQQILLALRQPLAQMLDSDAASSINPTGSLPGQAMLSAWHETQYSRLFRS